MLSLILHINHKNVLTIENENMKETMPAALHGKMPQAIFHNCSV